MDRFAVFVDAGYLLRQAIESLSQRASSLREDLDLVDPGGLVGLLIDKGRLALGLGTRELLRVYWYDGVMSHGLTDQQRSIKSLPDVLFRAGTVNSAGKQKGVDSLIITDLIELATHGAICDAVIVTGDADLIIGIDLAQKRGVRTALLGVEDQSCGVRVNQSWDLSSQVDRALVIPGFELNVVAKYRPSQPPVPVPPNEEPVPAPLAAKTAVEIKQMVSQFIKSNSIQPSAVDAVTKRIDKDIDRELLYRLKVDLGRRLSPLEKTEVRSAFQNLLGF